MYACRQILFFWIYKETEVVSTPVWRTFFHSLNVSRESQKNMTASSFEAGLVLIWILSSVDSLLIDSFRLPRWLQQPPILINPPFITPPDLGHSCWGQSGNRGRCETGEKYILRNTLWEIHFEKYIFVGSRMGIGEGVKQVRVLQHHCIPRKNSKYVKSEFQPKTQNIWKVSILHIWPSLFDLQVKSVRVWVELWRDFALHGNLFVAQVYIDLNLILSLN